METFMSVLQSVFEEVVAIIKDTYLEEIFISVDFFFSSIMWIFGAFFSSSTTNENSQFNGIAFTLQIFMQNNSLN